MMRMAGVSHITATVLLPCLYNGSILCRNSLRLRNCGSRETRFQLRCVWPSYSLQFDLWPPPIDHDFLDTISVGGGEVSEDGVVESFDNDDEALDAFDNGVVVVDLSHFGRIRVYGDDRVHFLHNQTTANFECLDEGHRDVTLYSLPRQQGRFIAHAWIMKMQ